MAGIWQQHQLWDGTYIIDDLLDAHELLDVKAANEQAMQQHLADLKRRR